MSPGLMAPDDPGLHRLLRDEGANPRQICSNKINKNLKKCFHKTFKVKRERTFKNLPLNPKSPEKVSFNVTFS